MGLQKYRAWDSYTGLLFQQHFTATERNQTACFASPLPHLSLTHFKVTPRDKANG